jgi:hypothetical protein
MPDTITATRQTTVSIVPSAAAPIAIAAEAAPPIYVPPLSVSLFDLLTEAGDELLTEAGDPMIAEI